MGGVWQVVLLSAAVLAGSNALAQAADHRMRPLVYPPALRAKNIGGQVILRAQLDAQGRPLDVRVERSSGHPEQDQQHPRVAGQPDRLPRRPAWTGRGLPERRGEASGRAL